MGTTHEQRRRLHGLRWGTACALLVLACCPALAEGNPLERAMKLRNDAAADWNNKRHADAAAKLRQALEIYAQTDAERPMDRAITQRALIWNLVRSGEVKAAQQSFEALMDLVAVDDAVYPEVDSAWSALWEAASACPTFEAARRITDTVRAAASKRSLDRLAGQALHSTGSLASKHKELDTAIDLYKQAIALRRKIGDAVGEAWSLNNLANLLLMNGHLPKALPRLKDVYELMHAERVPEVQQAVAWNVKKAIERLQANPDKRGVDWLRALRKASARSGFGVVVPPSHLDRRALALAEQAGKNSHVLKLAAALAKQPTKKALPELAADVTLRAARAACRAGKPKLAGGWLKDLDLGKGPCRPHLEARWKTALAIANAGRRTKKDFPEAAREAAQAWRELGDFQGRIDGLKAIVDAAHAAGLADRIPKIVNESEEASRSGGPGGAGGSAASGGDAAKAKDLPLDGALFRLTVAGSEIAIEDLATKRRSKHSVRWTPARVALNGLVLMFFGGYVVVESLDYGGAAMAGPAPGATTLDALGVYMPLPAKGSLVVQKNGAVRYETATVSPR